MDRERLQSVQQTDLTESRLNEDFVHWLKTSGPTWLLAILLGICAYLGWNRWKSHQSSKFESAWAELGAVDHPKSLVEVADHPAHSAIAGVRLVALLEAANQYLNSVKLNSDFDAQDPAAAALSAEKQQAYLAEADRLFGLVVDETSGQPEYAVEHVNALFGRAAVAESRGDLAQARQWYEQAAVRAEGFYPALAAVARERAASAAEFTLAVTLPEQAMLAKRVQPEPRTPVSIDQGLYDLLFPQAASGE
jgi:predicted negative regulator of RcsB-dependent stress response